MSPSECELFCRIYIDHGGPSETIERLVARVLDAAVTQDGIMTDQLDVMVHHGDSYPPIEQRDYSDWINWKYSLEVVPAQRSADPAAFAEPLKDLLRKLSESGVRGVPSCKFEELLAPWNLVNA